MRSASLSAYIMSRMRGFDHLSLFLRWFAVDSPHSAHVHFSSVVLYSLHIFIKKKQTPRCVLLFSYEGGDRALICTRIINPYFVNEGTLFGSQSFTERYCQAYESSSDADKCIHFFSGFVALSLRSSTTANKIGFSGETSSFLIRRNEFIISFM